MLSRDGRARSDLINCFLLLLARRAALNTWLTKADDLHLAGCVLHDWRPALCVRDRTASRVWLRDVVSASCESRSIRGLTSQRKQPGTQRLNAIASSSTYTPPSRSSNREMLNKRQMKPLPAPTGSMASDGW